MTQAVDRSLDVELLSVEDYLEITELTLCFVHSIRQDLPVGEQGAPQKFSGTRYFFAQYCAYLVEDKINPRSSPYGDERRWSIFVYCVLEHTAAKPAAEFLAAFDEVLNFYGWHGDAARAAFNSAALYDDNFFYGSAIALSDRMDPPPAIEDRLLSDLERKAARLEFFILDDMVLNLDPATRRALARRLVRTEFGLTTEELACVIRRKNPDWTDQQVADAVPCQRGSLYRFKTYMKLCEDIAREGIDLHPRGSRDRREDAAGRPSVQLEAFTDD
jgi:hypothetical protein